MAFFFTTYKQRSNLGARKRSIRGSLPETDEVQHALLFVPESCGHPWNQSVSDHCSYMITS
jgi:hypothetical protein